MSINLSKFLAKFLRHDAVARHVDVSPEGYVDVEDILDLPEVSHYTEDDIRDVVNNDTKRRFKLKEDGLTLKVKATQGHTIKLPKPELTPILHWTDIRAALHATRRRNLERIRQTGLSRMRRVHIHFAEAERGVQSGFPPYTDTVVEVDVPRAMRDGIKFYRSENDVILSPGNTDGYIPAKYTKRIYDRRTGETLD